MTAAQLRRTEADELTVEVRVRPEQWDALRDAARALEVAVPDWRKRRKANPAVGRLRLVDVADAARRGLTGRRALAFAAARRGVWRPSPRRVERAPSRRAPRSRRVARRARARSPGRSTDVDDGDPEPDGVAALLGGGA